MDFLDLLFPKRCVNCGRIGKYFCDWCRALIRPIGEREQICPMCGRLALDGCTHPRCKTRYCLDGLTSFFHYGGVIQKAVKSIKYRLVSDLAREFVSLVPTISLPTGVMIPIPLHASRFRERGFNQAEILGRLLHTTVRTDILQRTKATKPQAEMNISERLKNMDHVFTSKQISGNVLLFDDVFTTGATMRSAANALKHTGAKRVWAVSLAR